MLPVIRHRVASLGFTFYITLYNIMINNFSNGALEWIDILDPTQDDMQQLVSKHQIHEEFVADVLQPEHLPKYEPVGGSAFYILRYYDPDDQQTDTIQGLTNKIAIFQTDNAVITIHRKEIPFLSDLQKTIVHENFKGTCHLLNRIIKNVFLTFEPPAFKLAKEIDHFEAKVFLKRQTPPLEDMYHSKRKIEVIKRILILSKDILQKN